MKLQKPHKRNKDSEDSQLRIIKDHKNSVNELFNESAIYLLENQCSKFVIVLQRIKLNIIELTQSLFAGKIVK